MFRKLMKSWHKFWYLSVNYKLDMTNDFIDTQKYMEKSEYHGEKLKQLI